MATVEERGSLGEAYQAARERIRAQVDEKRAELEQAMGIRFDRVEKRLDNHDGRLDVLEDKVAALSDITVRAHREEGLPVPPALAGTVSSLHLVGSDGS